MPNIHFKSTLSLLALLTVIGVGAGLGWWLLWTPHPDPSASPAGAPKGPQATQPARVRPQEKPSESPIRSIPATGTNQRRDLPLHRGPKAKSQTPSFEIRPASTRRVTASLAGVVVFPDGSAVEGAEVGLLSQSGSFVTSFARRGHSTTRTDAAGEFVISEVDPCLTQLGARRQRPGEILLAQAQEFLPKASETITGIRLVMGSGPRIQGEVIDSLTLEPVANAYVSIKGPQVQGGSLSLRTGSSGRFLFAGLKDRPYTISVLAGSSRKTLPETPMVAHPTADFPPLLLSLVREPTRVLEKLRIDFEHSAKPQPRTNRGLTAAWRMLHAGECIAKGTTDLRVGSNRILGDLVSAIIPGAPLELELVSAMGRLSAPLKTVDKLHFTATGHTWQKGFAIFGHAKNASPLRHFGWSREGALSGKKREARHSVFSSSLRLHLYLCKDRNSAAPTKNAKPYRSTRIDDSGSFVFDELSSGHYWLTAHVPHQARCLRSKDQFLDALPITVESEDLNLPSLEIFRGNAKNVSIWHRVNRMSK